MLAPWAFSAVISFRKGSTTAALSSAGKYSYENISVSENVYRPRTILPGEYRCANQTSLRSQPDG